MKKLFIDFISIKRLGMAVVLCGMLVGAQPVSAGSAFEQRFDVEISLNNATLKTVVDVLKQQTDIVFAYDTSLETMRVNDVKVKAEDEEIETILKQAFQGTGIQYKIEDHIVMLYTKNNTASTKATAAMQTRRVTGVIHDELGEPIIGANVIVKGTTIGATTGLDGDFTLEVPANAVLQISYIGYLAQEVAVGNQQSLIVVLKEDLQRLDEVVVIGYGVMKKGDLSAAVATVDNVDKLLERPVRSVEEMLQGQIPGVTITSNGGHPNSTADIVIRGQGSRNGEAPLYVVDGVPGGIFNVSDVVSMTVLKDAASAAIYGSYAGASGVILVTTKQAAAGRPTIEYEGVTGFSKSTNLPQSLTIEEERRVRAVALGGEQYLPSGWDVTKNPYIGQTRTDWIDAVFRTAPFHRHNVIVSGGTDEFSNRASFEYSERQGTLVNTFSKSVTGRLNSMWKISKHIRIREDLSWQNNRSQGANTHSAESGVLIAAMMMPRNAEVYTADGKFGGTAPSDQAYIEKYGSNYADIHGDAINPMRLLKGYNNENNRTRFASTTFLEIVEPIKGLNFTSRFTFKQTNYFSRNFSTRRLEPGKPMDNNGLNYRSERKPEWNFENTLNYDRVFGKHNVGVMASTTANESTYRYFTAAARDFENESEALMYFTQAGVYDNSTDGYQQDRNVSLVGRLAYSYADRYFVTGSFRRDWAGRLPAGHKYGDFPAVTAAWKITSEPFMPKSDILNTLKLRASWGRIGNMNTVGLGYGYPTYAKYQIGGGDCGGQIGADNPIQLGIYNDRAFNPFLTWETSEQLDLGLDASLLNNRLSVTFDYFDKKTVDLIAYREVGWTNSIGINPPLVNEGEIRNSGFELALSWADKAGDVNYWVSANMATLRNRLYNIGEAGPDGKKPVWTDGASYKNLAPFRSEEGKPLYSFYLIQTDGVFMTQQEVDGYTNSKGEKIQPKAEVGDLKFVDENGDGKIDGNDRVFMGNAMPSMTYSFSGGLEWKNFTFSFMLQGVYGVKLFNAWKHTTLNESLSSFNRSRDILKALDGPNYEVPRISSSDPNGNFTQISDWYLEDGDFLRVKNISIGYSFTDLLRKNGYFNDRKSSLDLVLSVDNLYTFTNYSGIDPEVGRTPTSDDSRYSFGLDRGQYPVPRTFSLALKLKF